MLNGTGCYVNELVPKSCFVRFHGCRQKDKEISQECLAKVLYEWFARVTPKCFISVSREFVSHDCFAKLFHKSVMQGSSKIQESFTRVSSKGVLQECFPKSY